MNWKKFFLNKYTIFYILWVILLGLWRLPRMWIAIIPYNNEGKAVPALLNLILEITLPIYTIILIVKDILKKRYWIALINIIVVTILVFVWLYLRQLGIDIYYENH